MASTFQDFSKLQDQLGYTSIWSIVRDEPSDKCGDMSLSDHFFTPKPRTVRYEYVRDDATTEDLMLDIQDGGKRSSAEVTMLAVDGTIRSLWFAAESCIRQSGTHHRFIEDFEFNDDGSLTLITGS